MKEAVHVKAHRSQEVMAALQPAQKRMPLANEQVDLAAKAALDMHPPVPDGLAKESEAACKRLKIVYKVVEAILPLFPRRQMVRDPMYQRAPKKKVKLHAEDWHEWHLHSKGVWRCSRCMELREATAKGQLAMQGCLGRPKLAHVVHETYKNIDPELTIDKQLTASYRGKPLMVCREWPFCAAQGRPPEGPLHGPP